jgi:hypothetical protein
MTPEAMPDEPKRSFRVTVKGKALLLPIGGKLRLTRSRALGSSGALDNVLCRVIHKVDDWSEWTSDVLLREI